MAQEKTGNDWQCGADLVVKNLEAQGVKHVFGIPGAKIDRVFDSLEDAPSIETVVVRHEANAAFMAAAVGRLTGKAGVALVTSGPGSSNLITGLATATSEGDAVVAFGGAVKRADSLKQTHQSMDTVSMFRPVTKALRRSACRFGDFRGDRQRLPPRRVRPAGGVVRQPADGYRQ